MRRREQKEQLRFSPGRIHVASSYGWAAGSVFRHRRHAVGYGALINSSTTPEQTNITLKSLVLLEPTHRQCD